eukprot:4091711-Amphidinium_carterae.1
MDYGAQKLYRVMGHRNSTKYGIGELWGTATLQNMAFRSYGAQKPYKIWHQRVKGHRNPIQSDI